MYSPNILITNFCNQNCSFCFAAAEMKNARIDREMELVNFEKILKQMTRLAGRRARREKAGNVSDSVKLLGGEPTLHSKFEDIITLSLRYFPYVQIFTNGILPKEKADFLKKHTPRARFTFNVMTPGFLQNENIRNKVKNAILSFSALTEVTLSLTFDMHTDMAKVLDTIGTDILRAIKIIRLGFSNPMTGEKNFYTFTQFPKMGNKLYELIKYVREAGSKAKFSLNCGFTRCMFTDKQYEYIKKNGVEILGWGCFGKASSMDINPSMEAFHCFPLSTKHRVKLKTSDLTNLNAQFLKKRYEYWKNIYLSVCQKCPFYGYLPGRCPGPCIAFRMNSV